MPELSNDQFSQPRLPGFPMRPMGQQHVGAGNPVSPEVKQGNVDDYHGQFGRTSAFLDAYPDDLAPNPIHNRDVASASMAYDVAHSRSSQQQGDSYPYEQTTERGKFVPTWKVGSPQASVNPRAVEHLTANANMMDLDEDPVISEFVDLNTGDEGYSVEDGNHRVNAAQKQGRLFIPATVYGWGPKSR